MALNLSSENQQGEVLDLTLCRSLSIAYRQDKGRFCVIVEGTSPEVQNKVIPLSKSTGEDEPCLFGLVNEISNAVASGASVFDLTPWMQ